jgi:hypothetical protein
MPANMAVSGLTKVTRRANTWASGDLHRVFPQLPGLGAQRRILDAGAELAHDETRDEHLQIAVADPRDGRAYIGDRTAARIEGRRIGQRHGACRQLRFAQHEADRILQVAIGVVQRMLQAQHRIHTGREGNLTARRLGGDGSKGFESVHGRDYTVP